MKAKVSKPPERDLADVVHEKIAKLIAAKQRFNSFVEDVEQELTEAISRWDEHPAYISIQTAQNCIEAIKNNRSRLPQLINELKEGLEFIPSDGDMDLSDNDEQAATPPLFHRDSAAPGSGREEEEDASLDSGAALSGDEAPPDLRGTSFDTEGYLRQYDHHEDLDLNEFQDPESD
jgi:hypothetical protein